MSNRKLYVAAYDISDASRLRRALSLVKGQACGGQKSAYECYLTAPERGWLVAGIAEVIDQEQDRFSCIRIARPEQTITLGIGVRPMAIDYFYLG